MGGEALVRVAPRTPRAQRDNEPDDGQASRGDRRTRGGERYEQHGRDADHDRRGQRADAGGVGSATRAVGDRERDRDGERAAEREHGPAIDRPRRRFRDDQCCHNQDRAGDEHVPPLRGPPRRAAIDRSPDLRRHRDTDDRAQHNQCPARRDGHGQREQGGLTAHVTHARLGGDQREPGDDAGDTDRDHGARQDRDAAAPLGQYLGAPSGERIDD